ncbi:PQQ-binding-like beta-propeller repeat protein [Sphingosinicella terrae]|uniref:outer membrane protein assembly factor BamB family protein n=1 Tax=Sphingosinicella terrae TaxID=2172047 RepID=UPI000E0DF4FD|nr:PQQ-binding-like beta-propeller repeat protein [Sphingosinicella terrae]
MKRAIIALTIASLLSGCGLFGGRRGPTTPTVGERKAVLAREGAVEADPALADIPVTVPGPFVNPDWPQPGGNPSKSIGHIALGDSLSQAWSVSIGEGSSAQARLAAEPVVADGRIYTIDTRATVRAFDANTGAVLWSTQVRGENSPRETLFGGGVSFDGGRIYATNGAGDAAALDAATGAIQWIVKPGGPLRGAPTIGNENVYAVSQDNQLYALNAADGETRWTGSGSFELAGVFGAASPAFAQSTVVAGFSSGELTAYRYENGQVVWQDALARTGVSTIVGNISDIDADPVIDQGRVFSVGQGGRMVAVELITGQRAWEINIAGISTPWVVGDWVYVVTDQAQLLAVARASGRIRWISQLPRYRDPEDREGPIFWRGPVLAGNRLILTSSRGQIAYVSPSDGTIQSTTEARTPFSLPPVVANNTLYVLDDGGRLTAWR